MISPAMLNKDVTVERRQADGSYVPDAATVRAGVRPMSQRTLAVLGLEVDQARTRVYFNADQHLAEHDRLAYADAQGETRYVRVESYRDAAAVGRMFVAEGPDYAPDPEE